MIYCSVCVSASYVDECMPKAYILHVCVWIEKATDVSQASEDWALYMEICDVINSTEDGYISHFVLCSF